MERKYASTKPPQRTLQPSNRNDSSTSSTSGSHATVTQLSLKNKSSCVCVNIDAGVVHSSKNSHSVTACSRVGENCDVSIVVSEPAAASEGASLNGKSPGLSPLEEHPETVGAEKRHSKQSHASIASNSSDSSAGKRARRLARKVTSMSPGNNWRRLRNTLRAAHEMQAPKKKQGLSREDSFLRKFSTRNQRLHSQVFQASEDGTGVSGGQFGGLYRNSYPPRCFKPPRYFAVQHDGNFMFNWLGVVTVAVLYNLWTCILRQAFCEVQDACRSCWITFDVLCDVVYLLDILVQFRTGYLNQGLMVYDSKKLAQRYINSRLLYADLLCVLPLDFLQFYIGVHPMIRFPRFIKVYRTFRFIHMLESRTAYPNLIRVANLTHILFLGAHWFAAFYYMISEAENFKGKWSYPKPVGEYASITRKYLASLFWSTLTLTTIGDLPPPEDGKDWGMSNAAYVFVIVSYLIGVFVFATIVGQVGNVINNRNASRQEFERLLDGAKVYMQTHNVPCDLQKRVQRWYDYVWSRGRLNGCDINSLGLLPDKLKTELAIHVNLETLKKVTIFQECQPEFLHDLVLKMKAYIFTPGDLICRRGEVAREMFIIADGVVEIISESGTVLKQMGAGDFFGEIGILNLDGGINRRTADVRSVGYSELFVLSRDDVLAALKDHPDAESIIRDYGQRRLREIEAHRQKVKPLKQLATASQLPTIHDRLLINGRGAPTSIYIPSRGVPTSQTSSPVIPGNRGSDAATSGVHSQARTGPGGKTYTYCYSNEDAEGHVGFSGSERGLFCAVRSGLQRIFHRKVRRQKSSDDAGGESGKDGKLAWTNDAQGQDSSKKIVRLCCSTKDATKLEENPLVTCSTADEIQSRLSRVLRGFPAGYQAVQTVEESAHELSPLPSRNQVVFQGVLNGSKGQSLSLNFSSGEPVTSIPGSDKTVAEINCVRTSQTETGAAEESLRGTVASEASSGAKYITECRGDCDDGMRLRSYSMESTSAQDRVGCGKRGSLVPQAYPEGHPCTVEQVVPTAADTPTAVTQSSMPSNCAGKLLTPLCSSDCENGEVGHSGSRERPLIRVDSASTVASSASDDLIQTSENRSKVSKLTNRTKPSATNFLGGIENRVCKDYLSCSVLPEDAVARCRSSSAPNILARAFSDTSRRQLSPSVVRLSLSPTDFSSPPTSRVGSNFSTTLNKLQRHLGILARMGGSKNQTLHKSVSASQMDTLWTTDTETLLHMPHGDEVRVDSEPVVDLLLHLQQSHAELHFRMSELEAAYKSTVERLERVNSAQADILDLLKDRLLPRQDTNSSRDPSRQSLSTSLKPSEAVL